MIYFVSTQKSLSESEHYKEMSPQEALDVIHTFDLVQFDSETSGLNPHINKILCIQFGNKQQDIQIVVDTTTINILLFKEVLESKYLITQNGKFDLEFLYTNGIYPTKVYDTMVVEQFLYLGYPPKGKYGGVGFSLADIAERYLGIDIDKSIRGDIIWKGLTEDVIVYAANDVKWLEDIMILQVKKCREIGGLRGAKLEYDFVPVIAYLEWCGITLDVQKWQEKMLRDKTNLEQRKAELDKLAISWGNTDFYFVNNQMDLFGGAELGPKCTVNWGSSKQVIQVAKYLGFNTQIQDKKSGEDKDSVVEKHLKGQKGINDEFLDAYFAYQESAKLCSTYGQNYIDAINPKTGRIHTKFRQLGASSGRMTCGGGQKDLDKDLAKLKELKPSQCKYVQLQTLPSDHDTRAAFIAGEGRLMCSCDWSALESRLGADIYNEKSMIEEFLYRSGDIHSLVAKHCFPELKDKTTEEIKRDYPHLRKKAKPIGFSQQFGGSAFAIQSSLNCPLKKAEDIAKFYNEGFSGIASFKSKGSKFVRNNGYIVINPITGHRLNWWDWKEWKDRQDSFKNKDWAAYKERKADNPNNEEAKEVSMHFKAASKYDRLALNAPTQGTGIICLKHAMIEFYQWILDNNLFGVVMLCDLVHDEVVIDFPNNMPEVSDKLKSTMESAASYYCKKLPIPAEAATGDYWIH